MRSVAEIRSNQVQLTEIWIYSNCLILIFLFIHIVKDDEEENFKDNE
jgi:hypothetical protein